MTSGNTSTTVNKMGRDGRNSFVIKFTANQRKYLRDQYSRSRRSQKIQSRFRMSNNMRSPNGENSRMPPYFESVTKLQHAPQPDMEYLRAIYAQRHSGMTPEVNIKALRASYAANVNYLPQNLPEATPMSIFKLKRQPFSTGQSSEQPSVSHTF
jgi:hypothetical protein